MKFAVVGSGAVGGYYGAKLARAGHDVTFIARGAHLQAIRDRGLAIKSPLGDFVVQARAEQDPLRVPPVDVAIYAVKAYSNPAALPILKALTGERTAALTLQNGVESVDDVSALVGAPRVLGGSAYIATAISAPGVIEQTGTHRRIVFGEVGGDTSRVSDRVQAIGDAFAGADIISETVADARVPIWEKFCYLAPFAAFTGAGRVPIGPLWSDPASRAQLIAAFREVEAAGRAAGIALPANLIDRITTYVSDIPPATRSSLLIDLQQGKPIEVEALVGAVVRRAAKAGVPAPVMSALYAVLKPHAAGQPPQV
jgi:2-dehydropantoate 2-reductase